MDQIVDEFIKDSENEEGTVYQSFYNTIWKMAPGNIIVGFMTGFGAFLGSMLCHYYILPHLDLQFYSLFLIKLHDIK